MQILRLDGIGQWRNSEIVARYRRWCMRLGLRPAELVASSGDMAERGWANAIIGPIVPLIAAGDEAAAWIGIEMIEEDGGFAFGRLLKARCARELRRTPLNEKQKHHIRRRVVAMLERGFLPHEFRQYSRLARRVGIGPVADRLEVLRGHANPWVGWYVTYLLDGHPGQKPA